MNELLSNIYKALDDKKAGDIKVLDISEISVMADYFIITDGSNQPHVDALVDAVEDCLAKSDVPEVKVEGGRNNGWTLIDAGSVIIHVFSKENREFYNLERIWKDAKTVELN